MLLKNVLGDIRAESDSKMLDVAFVETPEYKGITETRDFNFIVGRRGTGKSALRQSSVKKFQSNKDLWIFDIQVKEHSVLALQSELHKIAQDYRSLVYIMHIVLKVSIIMEIAFKISEYYKRGKCGYEKDINEFCSRFIDFKNVDFFKRCHKIIYFTNENKDKAALTLPSMIADNFYLGKIEEVIFTAVEMLGKNVIILFDNLDEGWVANPVETSIVGGIARVSSSYKDERCPVHIYTFARDNMFRALAAMDEDFTRNIEGSTIRLKWDDNSLFHLVAERIKIAFNLCGIENNTKAWNRICKRELSGREGFKECTNKTLYRPRDIISLLNHAFAIAIKDLRNEIVSSDVYIAAKEISESRLTDLSNEYKLVFPSLDILIKSFLNTKTPLEYKDVLEIIKTAAMTNESKSEDVMRDYGILGSKEAYFSALYSIGFIGVDTSKSGRIHFCHDGTSSSEFDNITNSTKIWIHPCYWSALNILPVSSLDVATTIYDDYSSAAYGKEIEDLRMKQIGSVMTDIGRIPEGAKGANEYEEWILRAIKILFSNSISNPDLHPNGDAVFRRDVVGTIATETGFWGRVCKDYSCRQIVFEAKNYESITIDDIRQMSSYLSGLYGNFGVIVPRRTQEGLTSIEAGWVREIWSAHKKMIFIVPFSVFNRCIGKQRAANRFDYTEKQFMKILDTFERNYISIRHKPQKN